jgi:hypothetical protein
VDRFLLMDWCRSIRLFLPHPFGESADRRYFAPLLEELCLTQILEVEAGVKIFDINI